MLFLCATYPQAKCFHGGKHVLSLFFSNLSKIKPIQFNLKLWFFLVSNIPWSFLLLSAAGSIMFWVWCQPWTLRPVHCWNHCMMMREICLLQGAGKDLTLFYNIQRVLQHNLALKTTIQNPLFASLAKNDCVATTFKNIEDIYEECCYQNWYSFPSKQISWCGKRVGKDSTEYQC